MRAFKALLASLVVSFWCASPIAASAQDTIRLVTPYPPGGPTDVVARVIAKPLADELGKPVIVDNRAGASGTIGAGAVARAPADGNMLLLNTSIQVILPHLMKLPYDTMADFTPIGQVNSIPFILVANKSLPFKTVPELVAYAKANPGKLNFASNSSGSASHLVAEQFKRIAGINLVHVPYKGSAPAITDLIGGQVQVMFEQGPSIAPFLKSGQLRALGVTGVKRSDLVPDVPTFTEAGIPFVFSNWQGVWAPHGLPPATAAKLATALKNTLNKPEVKQRLIELGTEPASLVGAEFDAFVKQQYGTAGDIVKSANVKLD